MVRVTAARHVRDYVVWLRFSDGTECEVDLRVDEDDKIVLKPVQNDVRAAFGLVRPRRSITLAQMGEAIRKRAGR